MIDGLERKIVFSLGWVGEVSLLCFWFSSIYVSPILCFPLILSSEALDSEA